MRVEKVSMFYRALMSEFISIVDQSILNSEKDFSEECQTIAMGVGIIEKWVRSVA